MIKTSTRCELKHCSSIISQRPSSLVGNIYFQFYLSSWGWQNAKSRALSGTMEYELSPLTEKAGYFGWFCLLLLFAVTFLKSSSWLLLNDQDPLWWCTFHLRLGCFWRAFCFRHLPSALSSEALRPSCYLPRKSAKENRPRNSAKEIQHKSIHFKHLMFPSHSTHHSCWWMATSPPCPLLSWWCRGCSPRANWGNQSKIKLGSFLK